jgi:hypothetical protein
MQYQDTGWFEILFVLVLTLAVLFNILRAKRGKDLFIRRIAGLNAIDEAVGRATEMGRPVLMVPGIGALNAKSMQAVNIFANVTRTAAKFATPILFCCADAPTYAVAQEIIRDVYQEEGLGDRFDVDSVRFISDKQFAFAAGVGGLILREKAAATFFMGEFYAESLILAESANTVRAIQVAASTEYQQTPFFIAACDYVLIGDEFYAASAYLTRKPVLVGSLIGQDWCKLAIMASIVLGVVFSSYGVHTQTTQEYDENSHLVTIPARPVKPSDENLIHHLFNPRPESDLKVTRPQLAKDEMPREEDDKGAGK